MPILPYRVSLGFATIYRWSSSPFRQIMISVCNQSALAFSFLKLTSQSTRCMLFCQPNVSGIESIRQTSKTVIDKTPMTRWILENSSMLIHLVSMDWAYSGSAVNWLKEERVAWTMAEKRFRLNYGFWGSRLGFVDRARPLEAAIVRRRGIAPRIITYSTWQQENPATVRPPFSLRPDYAYADLGAFAIVASKIGQLTAPMTLIFPNNSHLWPHTQLRRQTSDVIFIGLVIYSWI